MSVYWQQILLDIIISLGVCGLRQACQNGKYMGVYSGFCKKKIFITIFYYLKCIHFFFGTII